MANTNISFKLIKITFGEYLGNQPHTSVYFYSITIADSNAGTFLAAVLEGKESKEDEPSYIYPWGINPKDATTLMH